MSNFSIETLVAGSSCPSLFYGAAMSPFGRCFVMGTQVLPIRLVFLGFARAAMDAGLLDEYKMRWKISDIIHDDTMATRLNAQIFEANSKPLALLLIGTTFQHRVWRALCALQHGETTNYGTLAKKLLTHPRAVGQAVGQNPVSYLVPCHRVLDSRRKIHGYRWGLNVKQALLDFEGSKYVV